MRISKYIFPAMLVMGAIPGLTSCSDYLQIDPLTEITLENFWNEKNDVDNVVTSCYVSLQDESCISRMMAWGEFRSDNIIGGTNYTSNSDLTNIFKENINSSNGFTTWQSFYKVINTCNTVLYYAPQVAEKDPSYSQSDLMATKAEVSALRDLCYFYLIRAFRDVPFTTEPYLDNTQTFDIPATKFDVVLDTLIEDLENVRPNAVKTYPVTKTGYQTAFITQDAISSMLCDMYLWKKDYANTIKYADLVINSLTESYEKMLKNNSSSISNNYQMIDGYPLVNEKILGSYYGGTYNDIFGDGNSQETIFELAFSSDETMPKNNAVSTYYGNAKTYPGIVKPAEFISNDMTLDEPQVYLDKYDARYYECLEKESNGDEAGINKYVTKSVSIMPSSTTSTSASYGDYCADGNCSTNWIIYRLTDIMLMKAEALVQQVNEDDESEEGQAKKKELLEEALSIVNTINKRASMNTAHTDLKYDTYSSKTQMTNLIYDERQRELMFEGKRWFDLVRRSERDGNTSYLLSKVQRKGSDNASVVASKLSRMDALYWPYNKDELITNKNLTQNPAYGTDDDDTGYKTTK